MKRNEAQRAIDYVRKHMDIGNPRKIKSKGIDDAITKFNQLVSSACDEAISKLIPYKKADYLEGLGCEILDVRGELIDFKYEDYDYIVDSKIFNTVDTIKSILYWAEILSPCCGETLDKDRMICPSCKEHC